jgi:hypothetical protein
MRCETCLQLLDDFIDGELSEMEHRNVEQHMNECVQCKGEAGFLRDLSHDAASLPKNIQPDKDFWPGIEAEITAAHVTRNDIGTRTNFKREYHQEKTAARKWWIAAAAMLGTILLAGTYLGIKKQMVRHANRGVLSNLAEKQSSGPSQQSPNRSIDTWQGVSTESEKGVTATPDFRTFRVPPPENIPTYTLDLLRDVFVSNYGMFGMHWYWDSSPETVSKCIIRFDQNETQSWTPPLSPESMPLSLYPRDANRLWVAYQVQQPEFKSFIAELDFASDAQIHNIWKSNNLTIYGFVVGPRGLIYMAGFSNDVDKRIAKLTEGQSITAELVHIFNPATGEEQHLFPMTIRPKFEAPNWIGQTRVGMSSLTPAIAVKSNGNFFITIDRNRASASVRDLIRNEAVEYSIDGSIVRTWKLGVLDRNAYLNRIFVDVDDSLLAEIVGYSETKTADSMNQTIADRYLLRVDLKGRVTRYELSFPPDEIIQGWMGQTQSLVTLAKGQEQIVRIHRLSP